eukprot:858248-Pyramimonas_sp.AAC.1
MSRRKREAPLSGRLRSKASRPLDVQHRFLVRVLQIPAVREMWHDSAAEDGQVQSVEHERVDLRSVPGSARGAEMRPVLGSVYASSREEFPARQSRHALPRLQAGRVGAALAGGQSRRRASDPNWSSPPWRTVENVGVTWRDMLGLRARVPLRPAIPGA